MSLQVQCQVVRACKSPLAVRALEWLDSGVLAHVTGQFIRTSELPVASLPVALVWFLSSVCSLVGFQVGALGVDLATAWVGATVHTLIPLGLSIIVYSIDHLVGTI